MPSVVAVLLTIWSAVRWGGVVVGMLRVPSFEHAPVGREARRQVVTHAAFTVFLSAAALVAWAWAGDLQLTEQMGGFVGGALMVSLAVGVTSRLMQPAVRTPETLDVCRLRSRRYRDPVKPIGSVLRTDEQGFIIPQASAEKIVGPWDEAVEELRSAVVRHLGPQLHSVYVRGSVARGTAIEGISDIDVLAIVRGDVDMSWFEAFERGMQDRYPFAAGAEVHCVPEEAVRSGPYSFLLKTQCVCIHGPDVREELPDHRIGPQAVAHAPHLGDEIERLLTEELPRESPDERRESCVWIMRRIVRTGFELVMADEGVWTRDLYPCFDAFARHHPERAEEMREALELAVDPTDDIDRITRVCRGIGEFVAEEGRYLLTDLEER